MHHQQQQQHQHLNDDNLFPFAEDDIKTKTIERIIRPMVLLVTSLDGEYWRNRARTKDAPALFHRCKHECGRLLTIGNAAIEKLSEVITDKSRETIRASLRSVQFTVSDFLKTAEDFVRDPSNREKRIRTSEAGRILLMNVARFLIDADMLEIQKIMDKTDRVKHLIDRISNARTADELTEIVKDLHLEMQELTELTKKRLKDMKSDSEKDDLQVAMALLKITTPIMIASSKAYIHHPELHEAEYNRNYAMAEMRDALLGVKCALNGEEVPPHIGISQKGYLNDLVNNLELFDRRIYIPHKSYQENSHRPQLEELLEKIVSGAARIADWPDTRHSRKGQIVDATNNLRDALQRLLHEYEQNVGYSQPSDDLGFCIENVVLKSRDLRRHLRRAIADLVSDAFLDTKTPIRMLIETASTGNEKATEEQAQFFKEHADRMVEVAQRICEMSTDQDANRVVRYAALCCERLIPQVIHAAKLLCEKPNSPFTQENMAVFKSTWEDRVNLLTMAADRMISVVDFLAVSEAHIQEDTKQAIQGIVEQDQDIIDRAAGAIRGRSLRVCDFVEAEMDQYPACAYADNVRVATRILRDSVLPAFVKKATNVVTAVAHHAKEMSSEEVERETDEMISACELIDNAIKDIRTAVLRNRNPEDVDSDNEYIEDGGTTAIDNMSQISDNESDNQQLILRKLPEESKQIIQKQIDVFKTTQRYFDQEVGKWDETGNDLITLAKRMCLMCNEMTQFTKGQGPLKRTKDVIETAQEIADCGKKLNALARQIGSESVPSETQKDLYSYAEQVNMCSHQLTIVSKVKADIQVVGDEFKVTGLESITTLIQNVKNLLNAVIHSVRYAYIASTKYRKPSNNAAPRVQWVLAPPDKQPLFRPQTKMNSSVIRRASERRGPHPLQALNEFHAPNF
jgi:catenin alpha